MNASKDDQQQNNLTKSSSYLENEGKCKFKRKRGANKIYNEFKTYPDL